MRAPKICIKFYAKIVTWAGVICLIAIYAQARGRTYQANPDYTCHICYITPLGTRPNQLGSAQPIYVDAGIMYNCGIYILTFP